MTEAERIAANLNRQMAAIVQFLGSRNHERDGALTAPEIGRSMAGRGLVRPLFPGEWARPWLNRLEGISFVIGDDVVCGLVKKLGWSGNARTWVLTDLGREVAAALRDRENRDEG